MNKMHQIGDLVHIPQSVHLIDCDFEAHPQLTIPLKVKETTCPQIGVVMRVEEGYVRVFCEGAPWAIKANSVYKLGS
jgi:hypothetical protein